MNHHPWNPNIGGHKGPRFETVNNGLVRDNATGLIWPRQADVLEFPLSWPEAMDAVMAMNAQTALGRNDWRLPNRRELLSLVDFGQARPAAPPDHPFADLRQNWHWTSTTAAIAPRYAWYVHFAGGRTFYGRKDQYCLSLPVAGTPDTLPRTGQMSCFDASGKRIDCQGTGHDGEMRLGVPWPEPRFEPLPDGCARDRLTDLVWTDSADLAGGLVAWDEAKALAENLDAGGKIWRLPAIRELESLVDASRHSPALPKGHPFQDVGEACWSGTNSPFENGWAYCLYIRKGAVGVGHKPGREFAVWAVSAP